MSSGGEHALQPQIATTGLIEERTHADVRAPVVVAGTGVVLDGFVAVEDIAEQLQVVIHIVGQRRIELAAFLAVLDRLVTRTERGAAGLSSAARTEDGGAAELAGNAGAVVRIHHQEIIGIRVEDQEVVRGQLARVAMRIVLLGDVALVTPDRVGLFILHIDQGAEAIVLAVEAIGAAHAEAGATAIGIGAAAHVQRAAVHAFLEDDVDHAGDRVRTVQG